MVVCLERGADLHVAQLMPLPLTISCFSKIQIGFAFLVPAHPGSPGQRAVKRLCKRVCNTMDLRHISTHYGISYPQNGRHIVTIDPVSSLHPVYRRVKFYLKIASRCRNIAKIFRGIVFCRILYIVQFTLKVKCSVFVDHWYTFCIIMSCSAQTGNGNDVTHIEEGTVDLESLSLRDTDEPRAQDDAILSRDETVSRDTGVGAKPKTTKGLQRKNTPAALPKVASLYGPLLAAFVSSR